MRAMTSWPVLVMAVVSSSWSAASCGAPTTTLGVVDLPAQQGAAPAVSAGVAASPLTPEALLTRLPRDAGAYVAVRPAEFEEPLGGLLVHALRDSDVGRLFGTARGIVALLDDVGVDPARPIVFAASAPVRGDGSEVVALLDSDETGEELAARVEAMTPIGSTYRAVIPLRQDDGSIDGLRAMFERLRVEAKLCPGDPRCGRFPRERPRLLLERAPWIGVLFVEGTTVELELARTTLWETGNTDLWAMLARAREAPRGGPATGRCATMDMSGAAWVCIDADRFAAYGTAEAMLSIGEAFAGFGFDAGERARVAAQGHLEVARIAELAHPSSALLDGGSAALRFTGVDYTVDARWHTTDRSRGRVEVALATRRCGGVGDPAPFFDALRSAFPDPGSDFADQLAARERIAEAGWAGEALVFARTWANVVAGGPGRLYELARGLGVGEICAAQEDGGLRLTLRGRAPWGERR
jgi:hypothetical protein